MNRVLRGQLTYLSGCSVGFTFGQKSDAVKAIRVLSTCERHGGYHHFAVTGEGRTVLMSPAGETCLKEAGLLS